MGICVICGTDHLPEIGPAGLPFLAPPPPANKGGETGTANDQRAEKKNAYFWFNLLIVNNINQYFNIRLHFIRFITYNRRILLQNICWTIKHVLYLQCEITILTNEAC